MPITEAGPSWSSNALGAAPRPRPQLQLPLPALSNRVARQLDAEYAEAEIPMKIVEANHDFLSARKIWTASASAPEVFEAKRIEVCHQSGA